MIESLSHLSLTPSDSWSVCHFEPPRMIAVGRILDLNLSFKLATCLRGYARSPDNWTSRPARPCRFDSDSKDLPQRGSLARSPCQEPSPKIRSFAKLPGAAHWANHSNSVSIGTAVFKPGHWDREWAFSPEAKIASFSSSESLIGPHSISAPEFRCWLRNAQCSSENFRGLFHHSNCRRFQIHERNLCGKKLTIGMQRQ
jgi:hypothetical protein